MAANEPAPVTRLRVTGGARTLRPAAQRVAADAVARGVPPAAAGAVELAIHELLANALEHGHLGDPTVPIDVEVTGVEEGEVTVRVADRALGGSWSARWPAGVDGDQPGVEARQLRGRGLTLVLAAAAGLQVVADDGCTAVLVRLSALPAPEGGAG